MMTGLKGSWRGFVAMVAVVATSMVPVPASAADREKEDQGRGQLAELTADWWQWILEQPPAHNPNLDPTGADAANGQLFGVDELGPYLSVSDGYWLYIPPLRKGEYLLNFGGTTTLPSGSPFSLDVTYHITVAPGKGGH